MEEMTPLMQKKIGHAFKLNIGINTGIVMWGRMGPTGRMAATVIGDDVNLASRLEHYATDGQIIVSDPVYSLTRQYFEYEILEPITVKGKSKPVPIYTPFRPRQAYHTRSQNLLKNGFSPLIERDMEIQKFHAHLSITLCEVMPRLILVTGEAGVGKSRLLGDFTRDLDSYSFGKTPIVCCNLSAARVVVATIHRCQIF
jgi:hypothetical protein